MSAPKPTPSRDDLHATLHRMVDACLVADDALQRGDDDAPRDALAILRRLVAGVRHG